MATIKVNKEKGLVRIQDHRANLLSSYLADIHAGEIDRNGLKMNSDGHVMADTIVRFEGNPSKAAMKQAARQSRTDLVNGIRKGQPRDYERDEANTHFQSAKRAHDWLVNQATFDEDLGRYVFEITPDNPVPFDTSKPNVQRHKVRKMLESNGIEDPSEEQIDDAIEMLS